MTFPAKTFIGSLAKLSSIQGFNMIKSWNYVSLKTFFLLCLFSIISYPAYHTASATALPFSNTDYKDFKKSHQKTRSLFDHSFSKQRIHTKRILNIVSLNNDHLPFVHHVKDTFLPHVHDFQHVLSQNFTTRS